MTDQYFNLSLGHRREAIERAFNQRMPRTRESIEYQLMDIGYDEGLPGEPLPQMVDECFERMLWLCRGADLAGGA